MSNNISKLMHHQNGPLFAPPSTSITPVWSFIRLHLVMLKLSSLAFGHKKALKAPNCHFMSLEQDRIITIWSQETLLYINLKWIIKTKEIHIQRMRFEPTFLKVDFLVRLAVGGRVLNALNMIIWLLARCRFSTKHQQKGRKPVSLK